MTPHPTPEQIERMAEKLFSNASMLDLQWKDTDEVYKVEWREDARYVLSLLLPAVEALKMISDRWDARDTGLGFPKESGSLAWAMNDDAKNAIANLKREGLLDA